MWPFNLSVRLPIVGLVGRYLTNQLIRRELTLYRISPLTPLPCDIVVSCGISTTFAALFPSDRQVAHALLTRPPLEHFGASSSMSPLDLHVLSTPPAFVLSQDQTLSFNPVYFLTGSTGQVSTHSELLSHFLRFLFCIVFKVQCRLALSAARLVYPNRLIPESQHLF